MQQNTEVVFPTVPPFKCPKCGNAFRNYMGMRTHYWRVHKAGGIQKGTIVGPNKKSVPPKAVGQEIVVKEPQEPEDQTSGELHLNHCPHCGYDLQALAAAMAAIRRFNRGKS